MNLRGEKSPGNIERENALLDFANRQAQEAILNPNLSDSYKNEVVSAAIGTIQKVAERKAVYYAKHGEGRRTRKPRIIYEAGSDCEKPEKIPSIIAELNESLTKEAPEGMEIFTVEWIAERAGINKNILYEWLESDTEFTTALERLKDVQENDPLKTGAEEDLFVNAMTIALLLLETRGRYDSKRS